MRTLSIFILLAGNCLAFTPTLTNFNTGQVSPLLEARTDYEKYASSSRTIQNMLVTTQGPVIRRPGTKYVTTQLDSDAVGRLIPYEHSVDDSYVLLFEDESLRFFRDGQMILLGAGAETMISGNQVAHWLLNETIDVTAIDDTGNGHDGTATIDIGTLHETGQVSTGCFNLDGQYTIERADNAAFSFTDGDDDTPFSLSAWVFVEETNETQAIISKWRDTTTHIEWRWVMTPNRRVKLELADSGNAIANSVSEWDCDDSAADKVVDDALAANNNGATQVNNTDQISVTGSKLGSSFYLNGTDGVVVPDSADLSFTDDTTDSAFSITSWVYVEPSTANQVIASKWDDGGNREWVLYLNSNKRLTMSLYDNDDSALIATTGSPATVLGTGWTFICMTYDASGVPHGITLYVNGSSIGDRTTTNAGYGAMINTATNVMLGGKYVSGSPTYSWQGFLDNTVIWSSELEDADISSLWNGGAGVDVQADAPPVMIKNTTDSPIGLGWHFLAVTYSAPDDGAGGGNEPAAASGIIHYVDGVAVASTAVNAAAYISMKDKDAQLRIGSIRNSANNANISFWKNKIDEVSVYSKVLTPANITTLYGSATAGYEISTPYSTADLPGLDFVKSEDIMYITHADHEPRQLSRQEHAAWTLTAMQATTGPFQSENIDTDLTITPTAATGTIGLVASSDLFNSGYVNSIWRIDQVRDTSQVSGTFVVGDGGVSLSTPAFSGDYGFTTSGNSDGTITLMRSTNNGNSWRPALTALTDSDFDNPAEFEEDGAMYRVVMTDQGGGTPTYTFTITDNRNKGVVRITGVENSTNATALVLTDLVGTTATAEWREGYWSDYRGWPETVTVHQQRLVFGGSATFPQTIWFGKTDPDDYTNFTEGTLDTSAFTIALAGNNPIQWLLSQDYLLIGTAGSCGKYGTQGEAVTPTSPFYQEQTRQGSSPLRGVVAGDAILYVERGSRKIREFVFDLQSDKFLSPDLSVLAPEITTSGIKEVAYQFRPNPILWCVLNNGDIATLTYHKNQNIIAWTKQVTDGDFESVATIPGDTEDEVWVTVNRTIGGVDARYVEQFQPQDWGSDDNDAWFLDSAASYNGVAIDTFTTGLDHLIAETVSIYADLLIESSELVDGSGDITIDNAAARVLAGLPYTSILETLPLAIDPQDKPMNKKIRTVSFDFYKTGSCEYTNGANGELTNINFKNSLIIDESATAQDLYTSIASFKKVSWPYGSMKKQTIYVSTDQPMPLTIRSITPDYQVIR